MKGEDAVPERDVRRAGDADHPVPESDSAAGAVAAGLETGGVAVGEAEAARHPVGSTVTGVVFSHHPFGIYVDVGIPFPGSVAADHLPPGPYPPVGSEIRAVVVRQEVGQLHLDARPFAAA